MTGRRCTSTCDFIAGGLVELVSGVASAVVLFGYTWWAPLVLAGAWGAPTGCCARARSGRTATPTRCARRSAHADYAYRLAVDPPAAKELRLFGLADWTIDRFTERRRRLFDLQ